MHHEQSDLDWKIEDICGYTNRRDINKCLIVLIQVLWVGGDKQWLTMDDMKLHDPFLITRFAVKNDLTNTKGW